MNRMIESSLETAPITSHTFAIIDENLIGAITPGFVFFKYGDKCGGHKIYNITDFVDKDSYTLVNLSSSNTYYCFNVSYDVNSAYCSSGNKPLNNRFINLYSKNGYLIFPKMSIYIYNYKNIMF